MIFLNQCPQCKSQNILKHKKIRFLKTMWVMLLLSIIPIGGLIYDSRVLASVPPPEGIGPNDPFYMSYMESLHPGYNALLNNMTLTTLAIIGLWVIAIVFFLIKKVNYECLNCKLQWGVN